MTKISNFALKIKGGWHLRSPPTLPPRQNLELAPSVLVPIPLTKGGGGRGGREMG